MSDVNLQFNGKNLTNQGWHFVLYQDHSQEEGVQNIVWKELVLSALQEYPTWGDLKWDTQFQVTLAENQINQTNQTSLAQARIPVGPQMDFIDGNITMDAEDGFNYEAYMERGFVQLRKTGKGTPGCIIFKNSTPHKQNLGISLSKKLLAVRENVSGGVQVSFNMTSTYYLALFNNVEEGCFLPPPNVGPIQIDFPPGMNTVEVAADIESGSVALSSPKYSHP